MSLYIDIKNNSCEYKLKTITYTYTHVNEDGSQKIITGNAIKDTDSGACNKFYFMVNENAIYDITIEDYFGAIKPPSGEHWQIEIVNFKDSVIQLVVDYDKSLTSGDVYLHVSVHDGRGREYPANQIVELEVTSELFE